jgi:hypothetical protein
MTDTRNTDDLRDDAFFDTVVSWDHEILNPSDWTWSPAPPAMGGESALSRAFCDGDREGLQSYVQIPYTAWGDYIGSTVERSNCRAIREDYPEHVVHVEGGYSSEWLLLPLGVEIPEDLFDRILALSDYPLWCEEDHSLLEVDVAHEALESYGLADLEQEVAQALVGPTGDAWDASDLIDRDELRTLFWEACSIVGEYPYSETATDAVLWHGDAIPSTIADLIVESLVKVHQCDGQLTFEEA